MGVACRELNARIVSTRTYVFGRTLEICSLELVYTHERAYTVHMFGLPIRAKSVFGRDVFVCIVFCANRTISRKAQKNLFRVLTHRTDKRKLLVDD